MDFVVGGVPDMAMERAGGPGHHGEVPREDGLMGGEGLMDAREQAFLAASAFVERSGSEAERVRLRLLRGGTALSERDIAAILADQRVDGGFAPFWTSTYSSVDATCFRLAQADQADAALDGGDAARALAFLAKRQESDGGWEEAMEVAPLAPPWARPGDSSARLYLTANAGFWCAVGGRPEAAARAAELLRGAIDETGRLPSFLHANWLGAALLWHVGDLQSAERLLGYLSERLPELSASSLAWLISSLVRAGVPPLAQILESAGELLLAGQRGDGSFLSEDGPDFDVHATLEAIRALRMTGRW